MNNFELNGKDYSYLTVLEAINDPYFLRNVQTYKKSKYLNLGSGFDIETTNFYSKTYDRWMASMWCWQWSFDEITVIGRTWEEFAHFAALVASTLDLSKDRKLLVFVHNLPFEWSFIRKWLPVEKILSKTRRDIMTFTAFAGMEFRDSLILTRFSLAKMAKNYNLGLEKLKGDLDYNLIRTTKTPFKDNNEIAYCINDVQILQRFFHKYIKPNYLRMGFRVPLTQTGIPRMDLKRALKRTGEAKKYHEFIERAFPCEEFYEFERRYIFRGGFTHANILQINIAFDLYEEDPDEDPEMAGFDRKSSYPAEILHNKFGMFYIDENPDYFEQVRYQPEEYFRDYGFMGYFRIDNIKAKGPHSIESKHKLVNYSEDAIFDNGRLVSASWIYTGLLETDYLNYLDFYDFRPEDVHCIWIKSTIKDYLPKFIIDTVYKYFFQKETLPKDTVEYQRGKEKLNSVYGCFATGINKSDYIFYNGELYLSDDPELPEDVRKKPKDFESIIKKQFLLPIWACQVSSGARRELLRMFKIAPYDSLYGDTDSDKIRHYKRYLPQIEAYNERMEKLNEEAANRWNLNFNIIKDLGKFVKEEELEKFKTLGAKRYLYKTKPEPDSGKFPEIKSVVAGMEKGSFMNYCKLNNLDPFEAFTDNLYLNSEISNKITSRYTDFEFAERLTDYNGESAEIHEKSCCALFAIPFNMKVDPDFLTFAALLQKKEERKKEFYDGIL